MKLHKVTERSCLLWANLGLSHEDIRISKT